MPLVSIVIALVLMGALRAAAQVSPPTRPPEPSTRRTQAGNLVGHGGPVKAISADRSLSGRILTGGFDYAAMYWDATGAAPKVLRRIDQIGGPVNATALVGKLGLAASDDGRISLWDLESGAALRHFDGHQGKVVALDVAEDGNLVVSAGWDRTARVWDLQGSRARSVLSDHTGPVNAAVFSHNAETVYTASADGFIRAFDTASGQFHRRVHAAGQGVNVLIRLSRSDRRDLLAFGTLSGQSGIVDGETGEIVRMLPEADRPILAGARAMLADKSSPRFALGGGDGRIRVFSADTFALEHEHRHPFGPVWALAFNEAATALYHAGLDDFVTLWPFAPRAPFEDVDTSQYPRRFQIAGVAETAVGRGEIQFARKCSICHTLTPDSANRAGPTLHNIFGRRIATLPGYPYSPELKTLDIVWTPETLSKLFEIGPDKVTPGSKMPLQVMSNPRERDDLVAFLGVATRSSPAPIDDAAASPQKKP